MSHVCVVLFIFICLPLSHEQSLDTLDEGQINFKDNRSLFTNNEMECRDYRSVKNSSLWCNFVNTTSNCAMDEGFVNYIKVIFCNYKPKLIPAVSTLYAVWLIFLFVGLGTTAEGYFCPSLEFIAHNLKLSQNIAGLTIVAFGNGSPDIFSAIAAFTNSNPTAAGVAVGALLGAAMLVTTVVAGLVATTQPFTIAQRPFMRDMVFFIAATFWLFCLLYSGKISLPHSIGFLCLYIVYVGVVVVGRYINQRQRARRRILEELMKDEVKEEEAINTSSNDFTEQSPLLPPPVSELRNSNNNNLDADGDWVDVRLRANSWNTTPHRIKFDIPDQQEAKEAVEDLSSNDEEEEETEEDFTNCSIFYIYLSGINPITSKAWKEAKHIFKFILILQVPWNVVCKATIPIIILDTPRRGWNRPLNCLSLVISPVFCVFATKGGGVYLGGVFPLWGLLLFIGFLFAAAVWFTSNNLTYPVYQWVFAYVGFVVAIVWTYITANEIVNLLQTFGVIFNVSNVVMGLTFLAWGNSIGDVVADVALAKQGFPRMSWSACFGGPMFNILIGVGLSCTIRIVKSGTPILIKFTILEAVICAGVFFSLCFTFILIPLRRFKVTPTIGFVLIGVYAVFLVFAILAGVGVLSN